MMKLLSKFIFWVAGWRMQPNWPAGVKKAVLIAIPHTSNWDILYARAAFYLMDIPVRFTIKKEVMKMEIRILSYSPWSKCTYRYWLLGLQKEGSWHWTLHLSKRRYGCSNRRTKSIR